jgi:transcriptional regulator with XRE-family HTH domain
LSADDEFGRQFGNNLARLRKALGLSQEELGFRAALHRTEIGMLERGIRLPRVDTMIKLCGSLGCEPNQLCSGLSWTPREASSGGFGFDKASTEVDHGDTGEEEAVDDP